MLGPSFALAVVLGLPGSPDPTALVGQLGSDRYADRESAEMALTKLGRAALPALRVGLGAKDPEIRGRATAVVGRIERASLLQPTPITLNFRDAPLSEAIRTINRRSGLAIRLVAEDNPSWSGRRLTLQSDEPIPFWKAIDAICEAGGLHYDLGFPSTTGPGEAVFPLFDGNSPTPGRVSDSGPFRIQLASVHHQSEVVLEHLRPTPPARSSGVTPTPETSLTPGQSRSSKQLYIQLAVASEPRLSVTQNGAVKLSSAVDDRGRSLLLPDGENTVHRSSGYFGINPTALVRLRVDLAYADPPGRRIGRIRGSIPVIVATRKPDPIEVPLDGSLGNTHRNREVELTIWHIRPVVGGQSTAIELTLKSLVATRSTDEVDPFPLRPESPEQQLEILDSRGEVLTWFPASSFFNGDETRLTVNLSTKGPMAVPASVRYYGILRSATEIPFEFQDVPMP